MFVTNWILTTKIQKISEITNFFRHYFLSRTEVSFVQQSTRLKGTFCKKMQQASTSIGAKEIYTS